MNDSTTPSRLEEQQSEPPENAATDATPLRTDAGEFQITIRKLETPVRPRGVLAE